MIDFRTLAGAREPLTLAGCVAGYQPWLMADLARAATGRAVFVAADDASARAMLDAVTFFAPELETAYFPAWDCLPYDRASPSMRVSSDRLAALAALAAPTDKAQLLVTTVNAALQRTLKPERIAALTAQIRPGARIDRDRLAAMLTANGFVRTDTVFEAGEYAVRGGLLDLFPAGAADALRLDFFGDEIETVRRFDPATQRTIAAAEGFALLPVNEVLLSEDSIKAFRSGYLERFGATATGDPLYEAVSDGRRLAGMEHWLPLFEAELATVFDYLGPDAVVVREAGTDKAADQRLEAIADYFDNRQAALSAKKGSYRPLPTDALYLGRDEWNGRLASARAHVTSPFGVPDGTRRTIDCETTPPRDFTPERTAQANVYEAVKTHIDDLRQAKRRIVLASYSKGARDRLSGLLADHGVTRVASVDSWQEALGTSADGRVALTVVPLDHGFTQRDVAVLTEQDMLGDRLVRRRRSAKKADAFMAELAMLTPGDLLVHKDHGIGRYEGLVAVDIGGRGTTLAPGAPQTVAPSRAPHDCVMLSYGGGDKLYVPVENIDVLSRYGSESEGVALDKLGGVAWQARKAEDEGAHPRDRGRADGDRRRPRAARGRARRARAAGLCRVRRPLPLQRDRRPAEGDRRRAGRPRQRPADGPAGLRRRRLRQDRGRAARGLCRRAQRPAGRGRLPDDAPRPPALRQLPRPLRRPAGRGPPAQSRLVTASEAKATREGLADGTVDIVVGTHAILAKSVEFKRLGLVIVDEEQRFGVTAKERLKNLKADVHVLTLTATPIPRTLQMALTGLRELSIIATPAGRPAGGPHLRHAVGRGRPARGAAARALPRRAELLRHAQDRRPARHRGVPAQVRPRGQLRHRPRPDGAERGRGADERLLRPPLRRPAVDHHRRERPRHPERQHDDHPPRRPLRPRPALPAARPRRAQQDPRLCLYDHARRRADHRRRGQAAAGAGASSTASGAGFQLASHDLDIRGAGNLLGDEQSGHIREVGFELYQEMLEEAIDAARSGAAGLPVREEGFSPTISVDAPILIPEDYVPDLNLRMALYRRLNELEDRRARSTPSPPR